MGSSRDRGETLVELLVTIAIMAVSFTALLGAVMAVVGMSALDRRTVQAQSMVKSWGEYLSSQVADAGAGAYVPCATKAAYNANGTWTYGSPLPALPSGFSASVGAVRYWNGTTFTAGSGVDGSGNPVCVAADDTGVQQVELQVTVDVAPYPAHTTTYTMVVRRPCVTPTSC